MKNSLIKKITALIILIFMFFSLSGRPVYAQTDIFKGYVLAAENSTHSLYVNMENGEFGLMDKSNGYVWWSNPPDRDNDKIANGVFKMNLSSQLIVTYVEYEKNQSYTKNNFTGSIKKSGAKIEKTDRGFKVVYTFPDEEISIPVKYTLDNDCLKAEIIISEIKENQKKQVYNIGLLPYLGAGSKNDQGYLVVPDGSGAIINFNNTKYTYDEYSEKIYGRDKAIGLLMNQVTKEDIRLPVYGIKNGSNALLAVVDRGDGIGRINAAVGGAKTEYNNVYCDFDLRSIDTYIIGQDSNGKSKDINIYEKGVPQIDRCVVKFYTFNGNDANYSGMARRYRKYLIDEKGMKENSESENPFYLELYGAVKRTKPILGIPMNITEPLTTYQESIDILKKLKKGGIDDIVLRYNGWMKDEVNKNIASSANLIGKLGGKSDFEKLISYSKENNVKLFPNVDFLNFTSGGNPLTKFLYSIKTISKSPAMQYFYKLNTFFKDNDRKVGYLLTPSKVSSNVEKYVKSVKSRGINGISLESMVTDVYSDFSHGIWGRQETEDQWGKSLDLVKTNKINILSVTPNAYAIPNTDYIAEIPIDSSHFDIEDKAIPFYQIALHGFKTYSVPSINLSSNPEDMVLKAVETGGSIQYSWVYRDVSVLKETEYNNLYSNDYKIWIDEAIKNYKNVKPVLAEVQNIPIYSHECVGDNVYKTEYENGISTIVNYNDFDVTIGNKVIKSKSFLKLAKGE